MVGIAQKILRVSCGIHGKGRRCIAEEHPDIPGLMEKGKERSPSRSCQRLEDFVLDPLGCCLREGFAVVPDKPQGLSFHGKTELHGKPEAPQPPERIIEQVLFSDEPDAFFPEIGMSPQGIDKDTSCRLKRHGIDGDVPFPEVFLDISSPWRRDVEGALAMVYGYPHDTPFPVYGKGLASEYSLDPNRQIEGFTEGHQVKVRGFSLEHQVTYAATDQVGVLGEVRQDPFKNPVCRNGIQQSVHALPSPPPGRCGPPQGQGPPCPAG